MILALAYADVLDVNLMFFLTRGNVQIYSPNLMYWTLQPRSWNDKLGIVEEASTPLGDYLSLLIKSGSREGNEQNTRRREQDQQRKARKLIDSVRHYQAIRQCEPVRI